MKTQDPNDDIIRRFLIWLFAAPEVACFSMNLAIDFTNANAYLQALNDQRDDGVRVTVNHLVAASIGRTLSAFPDANARLIRNKIVPHDQVNMAMPINLIGHQAENTRKLSLGLIKDVGRRSLVDIAKSTRKVVHTERGGRIDNPFANRLWSLVKHTPKQAIRPILSVLDRAHRGPFAKFAYNQFPMTTAMSNPAAALGKIEGGVYRGGSFNLPNRMGHIGTLWGLGALFDDVLAIDGKPTVRTVLPVLAIVDHRLIDGYRASKMMAYLIATLQDPVSHFGTDGTRAG